MKKLLPLFLVLMTAFSVSLFAQSKNIDAGIKALEEHKYEVAMTELNTGLADPGSMKGKLLAKAYFHRAKARMARLNLLRSNVKLSEELKEYPAELVTDLDLCAKNDAGDKYADQLKVTRKNAKALLQELAKSTLRLAADKNLSDEDRKVKCEEVIRFCDAAIALDKFDYTSHRMKGKGYLLMNDSAKALTHYRKADAQFFRSAPKTGDLSIGYMYIRIAELEIEVNNDMEAAQEAVTEGKERLNGEMSKIKRLNLRPNDLAEKSIKHTEASKDLDQMEGSLAARRKM